MAFYASVYFFFILMLAHRFNGGRKKNIQNHIDATHRWNGELNKNVLKVWQVQKVSQIRNLLNPLNLWNLLNLPLQIHPIRSIKSL